MKILIYDIEVSPNIGFFWQPGYNLTIDYKSIIKERAIICISYKWEGEDKINHLVWDENQDDKQLIEDFSKILKEAVESVAHNGDQFDLRWIRGRAIKYGIDLSFPIITHDTLKIARQKFRFNSNRLDYLAKYLEVGGKLETGFDLWKDIVLKKDEVALKKMVKYCDNDVAILEKVWKKLKPYAAHKNSVTMDRKKCPACGGIMQVAKHRIMASGVLKIQLKCVVCGKYNTVPASVLKK